MGQLLRQSQAAFTRDLPELLRTHPHQWAAYHGEERIGLATTRTALYQECLRRGLQPGQFAVLPVRPATPLEVELTPEMD
jgi:hypothetical protein